MTILAIDTSTSRGSVALLVDGELRLDETFTADRSHSASLFAVLERARGLVPTIDVVAVGLGPGSYAGVRIAIAAAMGLELGLGARARRAAIGRRAGNGRGALRRDRRRAARDVLFHAASKTACVPRARCSSTAEELRARLVHAGGLAGLRLRAARRISRGCGRFAVGGASRPARRAGSRDRGARRSRTALPA